jgi:glycosyltransferase involved in cell wall biosynthesis
LNTQVRVVHVLSTGDASARGISHTVLNLGRTLDRSRYSLSVLFMRGSGELGDVFRKLNIETHEAHWRGSLSDVQGAARYAAAILRGKYSIVHLHAGGLAPRMLSRSVSRARVIAHYHSLHEESGVRRVKRRSGRFADMLVANSRATADTIDAASVIVIHPGVYVSPSPARIRSADETIRIGVASRLVPGKGISELISAVAILEREGIDVQLDIAGSGPEQDLLASSAANLGITDRVRFLGWVNDVPSVMREWDIYAQPSHAEGFGISVLEAMASGLPVVASAVGGLREIVLEGETGFLVPSSDSVALAERISRLGRAPELRAQMGQRGRARVLSQFSVERETAAIQAAYERLLA